MGLVVVIFCRICAWLRDIAIRKNLFFLKNQVNFFRILYGHFWVKSRQSIPLKNDVFLCV